MLVRLLLMVSCLLNLTACVEHKDIKTRDWYHANKAIMAKYRKDAHKRLKPHFQKAKVAYPPKKIALLTFKEERVMELWAHGTHNWRLVKRYPLTASSGHAGPKLKERDRQIPEGIYAIQYTYPFSKYHLGMRINYPNRYDLYHAKLDGRKKLGGDIFIHGKNLSVGCLAIGDRAIEELYILVREIGLKNTKVIIASNDIRKRLPSNLSVPHPKWTRDLDHRLKLALKPFKQNVILA